MASMKISGSALECITKAGRSEKFGPKNTNSKIQANIKKNIDIIGSNSPNLENGFLPQKSPNPVKTFFGFSDNNTLSPPDTNGAVGNDDHMMTLLNIGWQRQKKDGEIIDYHNNLPSFWSKVVPPNSFLGDSRSIFDPITQRWFHESMQWDLKGDVAKSFLLLAVSTDSSGKNYNQFKFEIDPALQFVGDYPTMGFNKKWLVVAMNLFDAGTFTNFINSRVYVFDKVALFDNILKYNVFDNSTEKINLFTLFPTLTYNHSESLFLVSTNGVDTGISNSINIGVITGSVGSESYSPTFYTVTGTIEWSYSGPSAPQLNSKILIETLDASIGNAVFKDTSLWFTHTVFLPSNNPTHASIMWWQINAETGNIIQNGLINDNNNVKFYTFPSIAVDKHDDVLIGGTVFSPKIYASAFYAFRLNSDPLSKIRKPLIYKNGTGVYEKYRWGDYSSSCLDPSNADALWTLQEYATEYNRPVVWWAKIDRRSAK